MTAIETDQAPRRRGRPGNDLEAVLRAAVEVFNERGYDGASMEILSRAPRHRQVRDLPPRVRQGKSCSRMALDRALDGWSEAAQRAQELDALLPSSGSNCWSAAPWPYSKTGCPTVTLLLRVARQHRHRAGGPGAPQGRPDKLVAALVAEAERDGDVRTDVDPKVTARLMFGMINSIVEWYRPDRRTDGADPLADLVCAIAFDGLRVRR